MWESQTHKLLKHLQEIEKELTREETEKCHRRTASQSSLRSRQFYSPIFLSFPNTSNDMCVCMYVYVYVYVCVCVCVHTHFVEH